jgi:DNA-binding CsgD family transcriptional regulator
MVFDVLGLSIVDQSVYEALLAGGPVRAHEPDPELERLVGLGLVARSGSPPRYRPVPPGEALEALVLARERELLAAREAVAELDGAYRRAARPPDASTGVEVVHGAGDVMKAFVELQRRAPSLVRGIEAPPYIVPDDPDDTVVELLRDGLRYRIVYDRRALDMPGRPYGMVLDVSDGRLARIGDVPTKLVLTDEPAALMLLHTDPRRPPAALVIRHPALLAALSALFELAWARAVPISASPSGPVGIDDAHRVLLPLLVAGLTDQEIATKLGWSHRTVRRWIRDLMTRLGAQTRFQAGYEAVRRGWLEGNDDAPE